MFHEIARSAAGPKTRRMRLAARVILVAWAVTALSFIALVGFGTSGDLLSALGVIASALFAAGFLLLYLANRAELRAIARSEAMAEALRSSTTRKR